MIFYKSTRGNKKQYSFSEVILKGLADDGGLFIPEAIPQITLENLSLLSKTSFQKQAEFIIKLFQPDFKDLEIKKNVRKAYSTNFDTPEITPLTHLKNSQYLLQLWHGPSATFKDLALQIMPLFFLEAIKKNKKDLHYLILVATSGDTGKAALEGFKDKEDISIIAFYPKGHISKFQKLQMETQEGKNLAVFAVDGDFDTTQKLVKGILNDTQFNQKLGQRSIVLSSANSINWGRLMPQIIYHFSSYLQLVRKKVIKLGEQIDIAVPTGNFGNILAAYYAKLMGLPIKKLIVASNENNAVAKFIQTGIYAVKNRKLIKTHSPAMDILIASNIERLLFTITSNPNQVLGWMEDLKKKSEFAVDNKTKAALKKIFHAGWVTNEDCLLNIKKVYQDTGYLMDPHTSVAQLVAERYIKQKNVSLPVIICATAHFSKFAKTVYQALTGKPARQDEFEILHKLQKMVSKLEVHRSIKDLKRKSIKQGQDCSVNIKEVEDMIFNQIQYLQG